MRDVKPEIRLILASGSPRRQQFMRDLCLPFQAVALDIDESFPEHLVGVEISDHLALKKASAFRPLKANEVLITADTIVWFEGKSLGKPLDKNEAFQTLKALSGKEHEVFSSICLKSRHQEILINDRTLVEFEPLSTAEIEFYVERFKPFDKAGAYGIQDWIGLVAVKRLEGSFFNVVGFPTAKFYKALENFQVFNEH